jgi:transcriptional regulator NrdR family protein
MIGLVCPYCGSAKPGAVIGSKPTHGARYRRKECRACGKRYTTYESTVRPKVLENARRAHALHAANIRWHGAAERVRETIVMERGADD